MEKDDKSEKRNIPFSLPNVGDLEAAEVSDAICSGWITTGPSGAKHLKRGSVHG